MSFDPTAAAQTIASAHANQLRFENLSGPVAPLSIDDAYRVQEALVPLWAPTRGQVAGLKIATTTKIMQQLMGIDHPCGGMIYASTIHRSPARLACAAFMHLVVECELAVEIGADVSPTGTRFTRDNIGTYVTAVMPAFELIDDRNADYKSTEARTLIADNAWNGGIVLGVPVKPRAEQSLDKLAGSLRINGVPAHAGTTDDPMGALAWVANLAADRGRPLRRGMVVITGSVIPTLPITPGDTFAFSLDGLGTVEMTAG